MAMNALTPLASQAKGSFRAPIDGVRLRANAGDSAQFRKDDGAAQQKASRQRAPLQTEAVCQGDTKRRDPFWDGPRLVPAFVTQVLGQAMQQERNRLTRTPYGMPTEKFSRLLDTRF